MRPFGLVEGMEGVWAVAAGSLLVVLSGLVRAVRHAVRSPRRPVLALVSDDAGLSYTLSYVLAIPVYLFFLLIAYEATWLLIAKAGTMYAAHAGARSAVVWDTAIPPGSEGGADRVRRQRIAQAVATAMAPFATTDRRHVVGSEAASAESTLCGGVRPGVPRVLFEE